MVTPPGPPILILPTNSYQYYLSHAETGTFHGRYADVLTPYSINLANAANTATPANATQLIYTTDHGSARHA